MLGYTNLRLGRLALKHDERERVCQGVSDMADRSVDIDSNEALIKIMLSRCNKIHIESMNPLPGRSPNLLDILLRTGYAGYWTQHPAPAPLRRRTPLTGFGSYIPSRRWQYYLIRDCRLFPELADFHL